MTSKTIDIGISEEMMDCKRIHDWIVKRYGWCPEDVMIWIHNTFKPTVFRSEWCTCRPAHDLIHEAAAVVSKNCAVHWPGYQFFKSGN